MNVRVLSVAMAMLVASAGLAWAEDDDDLIGQENFPGEFSASLNFVTEYIFRGISQTTDGVPALQGSIDWSHEDSGLYLGVWGSNVKFADATLEMDWYGGWSGTVADVVDVGLGGIYYYYPGAAGSLNYDYFEVTGNIGHDWGPLSTGVSLYYSPNYFANSGDSFYVSTDVSVPLWKSLALNLHHGYQTIERNASFGTPDYNDFSAGVSATILGFDTSLTFVDTDLSETECFGGTTFCNSTVVLSIGRSI